MDILQRDRLLKFGSVPFTTDVIAGEFGDYSAVLAKIAALVDEGSLVRIKRGLYCLSPKISGHDLDSRRFATPIGEFLYRTVPSDWFSIGVRTVDYGEGGFLVASPEKALGDLLLSRPNLRISSPDSLRAFLEDDMRFDFDAFGNPDKTILREMAACGRKPLLMKALERMFS